MCTHDQARSNAVSDRWSQFLEDNGLTTVPGEHSHVCDENIDVFQKLTGDTLCDLSHTAMVSVRGDDAADFLQNQLSNDVMSLETGQSILAGYCNAKGRLICIFRAWRHDDGLTLQAPATILDAALERLRKYVLRAKVEFSFDEDQAAFGVCGKTAAKGLEQIVGALPRNDNEIVDGDRLRVVRVAGDGRPRFQVLGPTAACQTAWDKLKRHATVMGSWAWARLDILAGIPTITTATFEAFIPQMVNLDLLGGVNFKKGCYPGQEIIARMHYLGNLKQRMARFRVDDEIGPASGDRVYTQGGGSPTGTVVDAQRGAGSDWDLLAVVRIADLGRHTLRLRQESGAVLFQHELPYELPVVE